MSSSQIFVSYSGHDSFEAGLLKFALDTLLRDLDVQAWTFQRDQKRSERNIANALKEQIRRSCAVVFLVSPITLDGGATQWMELAYADAFSVEVFVLLHHLTYSNLKSQERGVPPLLLAGQCSPATEWREIMESIRHHIIRGLAP